MVKDKQHAKVSQSSDEVDTGTDRKESRVLRTESLNSIWPHRMLLRST